MMKKLTATYLTMTARVRGNKQMCQQIRTVCFSSPFNLIGCNSLPSSIRGKY